MDKPTHKTCYVCRTFKPLEDFHRSTTVADGRQGRCKACEPVLRQVRRSRNDGPTARMVEARALARAATRAAGVKTCIKCQQTKPLDSFQKRAGILDGFNNSCKTCRKAEKAAEYERNREEILARKAARYAADPEKTLKIVRRWQAANADLRREYEGRRRARQRETFVGPVDVHALWTGSCAICGEEIPTDVIGPHPLSKSLDHIVPLVLGGSHEQSNLQWTHLRCNIRKGARLTA